MTFCEIMIETPKKAKKYPILHLNFIPGKYDFKLKSWKNRGKTPKIVKKDIRDDP